MEYNAQNLEYAVSVFYKCEQGERSQAHQWLTAAQSCPDAWSFVWELLQLNKLTEVQFFAANTLHNKIKKCLNEVPQDNLEELRYKIVQAIFTFRKGPKIVLDRLCISLAALFLQVDGLTINDLTKPFFALEDRYLLVDILTAVPDQFSTMTMGNEQRTRTYRLMVETQKLVLKSMHENLTDVHSLDTPVTEELIALWSSTSSCLGAWLGMAGDVTMEEVDPQGVPPPDLADLIPIIESLLGVVYRIYSSKTVQEEAVADTALEACEAALQAVRVTLVAPNSRNYGRAAMDVASIILKLALPIIQQENVPQSPNEELLHSIYLLAVCLGEAHSVTLTREIANKNNVAESFLQLLLSCQTAAGRYPVDETRSSLTFGFWYHLQDEISSLTDCYKKSEHLEIFRNIKSSGVAIFTQLLYGLLQKSAQPPMTHDQTEENKELWRRYRQDIADTLMCCHTILKEVYWNTVEACWESAADDLQREAALHAVVALADSAPLSGARPLPALPAMLQRAAEAARPDLHPVLANTAIECLGAYAAWLGELCSDEQPEEQRVEAARWCAMALGAVGAAFQQAPLPCSLALQRLCSECPSQATQFAPDIVRAVQVGWGNLEGSVLRRLLNAAGGALAAAPHADSATLIAKLTDTLVNDMIPRQEGRESEWVASCDTALRAASSLLSGLSRDTVLCGAVLQALRPALPFAAPVPQLSNSLFNMIKQIVTVLMDDMQPMLGEMCEITAVSLSTGPQPDSLHVVRLLVLMFVDNIACEDRCRWLLQQTAASMLRSDYCSSPELMRERADVIEAFFILLTSFAKKKPRCLDFINEEMPKIVQLAGISMKLWEGNASRGACQFVAALAHERPLHVLPHAAALVQQACVCIGGALPRKYVDPMADLLLGLNRVPWTQISPGDLNLGVWLRAALVPENFPTRHAKESTKNKFIAAVIKEKSDKRRMLEAIREFSLACRGLIGTEYGKQTEASRELVT